MPRNAKFTSPIVDWPAYWFILLDRYLQEGELEAAAEAQRQLDRLGVEVRYRARPLAATGATPRGGQ
jgi:hypothetical protein